MAIAYMDKDTGNTEYYRPPAKKPDTTSKPNNSYISTDIGYNSPQRDDDSDVYRRLLGYMNSQRDSAAAERRARYRAANEAANRQLSALKGATAQNRTNAYVQNQITNRDMGQQQSLLGLGGLTESSLMGQAASYQNSLGGIDRDHAMYANEIEGNRSQGIAAADKDYNALMRSIASEAAKNDYALAMKELQSRTTQPKKATPKMSMAQYLEAIKRGYTGAAVEEAKKYYGELQTR